MTDPEAEAGGNDGESAPDVDPDPEPDPDPDADAVHAVVLDYLPHGRPDDDRPAYQKSALAHAIGEATLGLYELSLAEEADISIGDRVRLPSGDDGPDGNDGPDDGRVTRVREIGYDDLSRGATQELEYAVEELIDASQERFVNFYNGAGPITLRLHQLNLLPGIGKKLRNKIIDERKRAPFEDFADVADRVGGLYSPKEVLVERIVEELRDEDLKYRTFVGRESFVADG